MIVTQNNPAPWNNIIQSILIQCVRANGYSPLQYNYRLLSLNTDLRNRAIAGINNYTMWSIKD
ncbi:hypothetical protein D5R40_27425 [Okeania hirsuta]|uniref:Uncharacterized protein n=1 Tax=Okeania hirsuta TaxID=1458930 RepID=A0A3N6PJU4_9CYAN|nr:hypothetical protein D4Z78_12010 [Okeania hirsuta]RQH27478.1 hypothetical protein D5R40_27425 [Okeania hirsuta]